MNANGDKSCGTAFGLKVIQNRVRLKYLQAWSCMFGAVKHHCGIRVHIMCLGSGGAEQMNVIYYYRIDHPFSADSHRCDERRIVRTDQLNHTAAGSTEAGGMWGVRDPESWGP